MICMDDDFALVRSSSMAPLQMTHGSVIFAEIMWHKVAIDWQQELCISQPENSCVSPKGGGSTVLKVLSSSRAHH